MYGSVQYAREGPIGFRGMYIDWNMRRTEKQWGGNHAAWHQGAIWILGGRNNQLVAGLEMVSHDNGDLYFGSMSYHGKGPIGFKASRP